MNNLSTKQAKLKAVNGSAVKNQFTIPAGAAGWIDTDISTSDIPAAAVAIVVSIVPTGVGYVGARPLSGVNAATLYGTTAVILEQTIPGSNGGHLELYRNALSNTVYQMMGYWL